jgi:hypothetical protein
MKTKMFLSMILFAALVLFVTWAWGHNAFAEEQREPVVLPDSCTVMSMKPAERAVHLKRLGMLERSASQVGVSPEGFSFVVSLSTMPVRDLQGWAENEQKCCSYLKIESQILDEGKRAKVRVVCPAGSKNEVMRSFGLEVHK